MNAKAEWKFAPACDLTFSNSNYGFRSTMVAGESQNPGIKELMKLATHFGLKNANSIINKVQDALFAWNKTALECGLTKKNP